MSLIIKELIEIGTNRLVEANCNTPKLDAEVILGFFLGFTKEQIFLHYSNEVNDRGCDEYFKLVDERAFGKPVQYIVGKQEFMGLDFIVNENVLIPRPDTETLVEAVIEVFKDKKKLDILDLCCGSGAIGISVAKKLAKATVTGSDISEEALQVAKRNASKNGVSSSTNFVKGDLFKPFVGKIRRKKFDLILSNPPYIPTDIIPTLQKEIVNFEPIMALDGGEDGLDFYRPIVADAAAHLNKNGTLMLEIGCDQAEDVIGLLICDTRYKDMSVLRDLAGKDRVVVARI